MKNNALNASDQQKKQGLTRRHRDKNFHCSGMAEWRNGMKNSGGIQDWKSLIWTLLLDCVSLNEAKLS